jgi:hypothetical protein
MLLISSNTLRDDTKSGLSARPNGSAYNLKHRRGIVEVLGDLKSANRNLKLAMWVGKLCIIVGLSAFVAPYASLKALPAEADFGPFLPAYFSLGFEPFATLFPPEPGKPTHVSLPQELRGTYNLIAVAPNGQAAYFQMASAWITGHSDSLVKVQVNTMKWEPVPGSGSLGNISSLTVSAASEKLFVSATGRNFACGAWEIDPQSGVHHELRVGSDRECGKGSGNISPEGDRVLHITTEGRLSVVDLATGAEQQVGKGRGAWSPNSRWIAAADGHEITLIDSRDLSKRRGLGGSGADNHLVWSPDSRHLLFVLRGTKCGRLPDAETLAVIDIETGERKIVSSSRCAVTSSQIGWIDSQRSN